MNPRLLAHRRCPRPEVLETLSDEELAELVAHGHEEAFEALATRHRRILVNHCSQLVGRADAEEAVQETLLRAYLSLSRGHSVQRVSAWLRTIAHNTALNVLRSRAARPESGEREASEPAGDPFERRERLQLFVEALSSLPARQREALVMRELEGRSYAEIESRLRTSNGAVRQLLNRARAHVRTRLGAVAGFEPALRWIVGNGSVGTSAVRLGALGGGCAVTVKLCTTALLPATLVPLIGGGAARPAHPRHAHSAGRAMGATVSRAPAAGITRSVPVSDRLRAVTSPSAASAYVAYHPTVNSATDGSPRTASGPSRRRWSGSSAGGTSDGGHDGGGGDASRGGQPDGGGRAYSPSQPQHQDWPGTTGASSGYPGTDTSGTPSGSSGGSDPSASTATSQPTLDSSPSSTSWSGGTATATSGSGGSVTSSDSRPTQGALGYSG